MMIKSELDGHLALLRVAFPYLLVSLGYAAVFLLIEENFGDHIYMISGQVGSVFGLALAFFLGFRMNSAYDRWWEGRKIIGELINNTRSFANKVYTYIGRGEHLKPAFQENGLPIADELLDLTQAFVLQFSTELRGGTKNPDPEAPAFVQLDEIVPTNKLTNEILLAFSVRMDAVMQTGSDLEKSDLMAHITRFYDIQGKAERIKYTPFLMIYSAFTRIIVFGYVLLTPLLIGDIDIFGENSGMEYLSVPIMALIGTAFLTINRLANLYGAPFSGNVTALPVEDIATKLIDNVREVREKCVVKIATIA
jgi:putative membrane protein